MAYKQKSAPFKQEKYSAKLGKEIEENTAKNKQFKEVESKAKTDSISAASSYKGNIFKKREAGNKAANITRKAGGVAPVERFSNPHEYTTYQPRTGEKDTYIRKAKVEKDVPMAYNPRSGELDVKPSKSPAKQMETIKKIASKVKEGVKKVGKIVGYRDTSGDDSRYGDKIKKTPPVKQLKKRPVAKMKKC
jgi:hypothetical protein